MRQRRLPLGRYRGGLGRVTYTLSCDATFVVADAKGCTATGKTLVCTDPVDGPVTFTVKADQVDQTTWEKANHHGFFIILNVAIGGVFPAKYGGAPTPATRSGVPMLVDKVTVSTRGSG